MDNKVEIFKLAIASDERGKKFTAEDVSLMVEWFQKAMQLSKPDTVQRRPSTRNTLNRRPSYKGNTLNRRPSYKGNTSKSDGRSLFIKQKMKELKSNGKSFEENNKIASQAWEDLSSEERIKWMN
jgi:hypothetical protein